VFKHFPIYHMKIRLPDFNVKLWETVIFSNQQVGMRVHIRIAEIMVLK